MSRLTFFATFQDLRPVATALDQILELQYIEFGSHENAEYQAYCSSQNIPDFGSAFYGDAVLEKKYIVATKDTTVMARTVLQYNGLTRYILDQLINPATVVLQPGGLWQDTAVIQGELTTVHKDSDAQKLFRHFAKNFKSRFSTHNGVWIGEEALNLCRQGKRLTYDVRLPLSNDFHCMTS